MTVMTMTGAKSVRLLLLPLPCLETRTGIVVQIRRDGSRIFDFRSCSDSSREQSIPFMSGSTAFDAQPKLLWSKMETEPRHTTGYVSDPHRVTHCLPSQNCITAHLPLQAHFLPLSPPPPSVARNSSSLPAGRPATTSALHVRSARVRIPEDGPKGPIASANGVVGSHMAYESLSVMFSQARW